MGDAAPLRPVHAAEIEDFERDGVVVLRSILPTSWLERLAEPVARAYGGEGTVDLSAVAGAEAGRPRFRAGVNHWLHDPVMRAFACDSPLPAIAAALLRSAGVWLYEDSVLVKPPGTSEETRFHQDLPYFHVEGDQLATFWCPLDPVVPETGALKFVRGSHRWGRSFRPNLFVTDQPIPNTDGEVVPPIAAEDPSLLCVALEPGDLTVHHARTLHGSGPNTSKTMWRRAVSVRYCGDDARVHLRSGLPIGHRQSFVEGEPLADSAQTPQVWPRP